MSNYAKIVLSVKSKEVDRPFDYTIPNYLTDRIREGMRVLVPFGAGNKKIEGFVVGLADESEVPADKLKSIVSVLDNFSVFSPDMLKLANWMKEKYYSSLSECLQCIMPTGIAMKNDFAALSNSSEAKGLRGKKKDIFEYVGKNSPVSQRELTEEFGADAARYVTDLTKQGFIDLKEIYRVPDYGIRIKTAFINDSSVDFENEINRILEKPGKHADVLGMILENGSCALSDIKSRLKISDSPIKTLEKQGIIEIKKIEIRRNTITEYPEPKIITPTAEQASAIEKLMGMLDNPQKKTTLLHGVTGSGKTEIYMQLIEKCIARGKQAIMLVPEISLTPQAVEVFASRFGNRVTVTHSRLSLGERYDQWKKARDNQISVIIGPRSAIFTPFDNLGIIIVDEEHEHTYKSETTPKYYVKEVAEEISRLTGCFVLLGSATPSVSTFHEARTGRLDLITLRERVNKRMPEILISDMRLELALGNRSVFSKALFESLVENLRQKQQSILFINRRGHSTFVSCRACGYVMSCEACNVNYTYHIYNDRLVCHYCGKSLSSPKTCPVCGSKHIRFFGAGTQKVEEELKTSFPDARIIRMDMDTTSAKNSHARIIKQFQNGEADILVGTQMIAKGLNFPNVSLVGIIAADIALNAGDFRSAETAYQLITQVSGRAGRAKTEGKVIIQTYNPEHYSIVYACENKYEDFYEHEITVRRAMAYPPFTHIFTLLFTGEDEKKIITVLYRLFDVMKAYNRKGFFEMLGPAPASISKIRMNYRWKLLVKALDEELLKTFVFYCMKKLKEREDLSGISLNLTLDPFTNP